MINSFNRTSRDGVRQMRGLLAEVVLVRSHI
jgi:hypothetical protein